MARVLIVDEPVCTELVTFTRVGGARRASGSRRPEAAETELASSPEASCSTSAARQSGFQLCQRTARQHSVGALLTGRGLARRDCGFRVGGTLPVKPFRPSERAGSGAAAPAQRTGTSSVIGDPRSTTSRTVRRAYGRSRSVEIDILIALRLPATLAVSAGQTAEPAGRPPSGRPIWSRSAGCGADAAHPATCTASWDRLPLGTAPRARSPGSCPAEPYPVDHGPWWLVDRVGRLEIADRQRVGAAAQHPDRDRGPIAGAPGR